MHHSHIFDAAAGYGKRFRMTSLIRADTRLPDGRAIEMMKEQLAHQLARELLRESDIFQVSEAMVGLYAVDAAFFVLTTEQLRQFATRQFKEGLDHATGFMPRECALQMEIS
ncbi:MAG: hypothetical protein KGZ68_04645 [Dechloromonas sp.]|nr:hypothetical protein [Dechloromonas sp.]